MSIVTNLILAFSILESFAPDDEDYVSVIRAVNHFFGDKRGFIEDALSHEKEPLWSGGTKFLEHPTLVGSFNHLVLDEFIQFLRTLPWKRPEEVQLVVCEQEDDKYRLINVFSGSAD